MEKVALPELTGALWRSQDGAPWMALKPFQLHQWLTQAGMLIKAHGNSGPSRRFHGPTFPPRRGRGGS